MKIPYRVPRLRSSLVVLMGGLLLAGCGGSPTATDEEQPAASGTEGEAQEASADEPETVDAGCPDGGGSTARLAEINAELEGLDRDARQQRLIELADEEGGTVSFYGSTNPKDANPLVDGFEDATDIDVSHYRANANGVLQRILEENAANYAGADVVNVGEVELMVLEDEGILASYESALAEDIYEGGVKETSIDVYRVMRVPLWNTDRIPAEDAPTSWEDVLTNYEGELIFDPTDWDWFGTLTKNYFIAEQGMSEDEAIEMWKEAARGASQVKGHTLGTELVTTGEVGIAAVTYQHGHPPEGAPVEWEPPFYPVIPSTVGVGILECAPHPAAALLFAEYQIGAEGQTILFEGGRTTTNVTVDDAWPEKYDSLTMPFDESVLTDEREKWEGLWEEVLRESGSL